MYLSHWRWSRIGSIHYWGLCCEAVFDSKPESLGGTAGRAQPPNGPEEKNRRCLARIPDVWRRVRESLGRRSLNSRRIVSLGLLKRGFGTHCSCRHLGRDDHILRSTPTTDPPCGFPSLASPLPGARGGGSGPSLISTSGRYVDRSTQRSFATLVSGPGMLMLTWGW